MLEIYNLMKDVPVASSLYLKGFLNTLREEIFTEEIFAIYFL